MKKEYILAIITVCLWGTLPATSKMLFVNIPEIEVLFLTSLLATVFLFFVNLATGHLKELKKYQIKDIVIILGLGILGTLLYNLFYNYGLARLSSQEACVINYLWPIMIVILSCVFLHETLTARKLIAIFLSFAGIVILVSKLDFKNFHLDSPMGVLACVIAAVCYGLFSTLNKVKAYDQYVAMNLYYLVTTVISGIMLGVQHNYVPIGTPGRWLNLLWVGIVANAIPYLCWCLALVYGDTTKIANMAYITPFTVILFSRIILKEEISIFAIIGLLFILLGIFIQMTKQRRRRECL